MILWGETRAARFSPQYHIHKARAAGARRRWCRVCLPLQHKGDEPFRASHILLIALAQTLLEDALFYMDAVREASRRTAQ